MVDMRNRIGAHFKKEVGAMYIEFAMPRACMHRESQAMRRVLEASRYSATDCTREAKTANDILLSGSSVSAGVATGKAFLARKTSDYRHLPTHSIAVAAMNRPEWLAHIDKVSGIITDLGGSLCHAAIVAREYRIPRIVGTRQAAALIRSNNLLSKDGTSGQIHKL
jgi:phosphoenolpyruvate synthase/pyruvate phosphate dikinase